jgi:hypothetical protein
VDLHLDLVRSRLLREGSTACWLLEHAPLKRFGVSLIVAATKPRYANRDSMPIPKVMALVLNWNLPDDTRRCVQSLERSDYPT